MEEVTENHVVNSDQTRAGTLEKMHSGIIMREYAACEILLSDLTWDEI